jgi:hypothetical protein
VPTVSVVVVDILPVFFMMNCYSTKVTRNLGKCKFTESGSAKLVYHPL